VDFWYGTVQNIIALICNFIFSGSSLDWTWEIICMWIVSFFLGFFTKYITECACAVSEVENEMQNINVEISYQMMTLPDNFLLKNNVNIKNWQSTMNSLFERQKKTLRRPHCFAKIGKTLFYISLYAPACSFAILYAVDNSSTRETVEIFLDLTRLLWTFNSYMIPTFSTFDRFRQIKKAEERCDRILSSDSVEFKTLQNTVKVNEITVNEVNLSTYQPWFEGLLEDIKIAFNHKSGAHFTIRGGNGVGKSNLMILLLSELRKLNINAALLPRDTSKLSWAKSSNVNPSTGQRLKEQISELLLDKPGVLFLDEWSSPLDYPNFLLETKHLLAEKKKGLVIVEIVHATWTIPDEIKEDEKD